MKKIKNILKTKKLFLVLFTITLIFFIMGLLLISILSKNNREIIVTSLNNFFTNILNNKINYKDLFFSNLSNNILLNIIIWILVISIVGIPIVIIILCFKTLSIGFTFAALIYTYKLKGIYRAFIYIIPNIINLFIVFILTYYSVSFSIIIFNYFFRKKAYNKKIIINKYIKLLIFSLLVEIVLVLIETFLIPKLLKI